MPMIKANHTDEEREAIIKQALEGTGSQFPNHHAIDTERLEYRRLFKIDNVGVDRHKMLIKSELTEEEREFLIKQATEEDKIEDISDNKILSNIMHLSTVLEDNSPKMIFMKNALKEKNLDLYNKYFGPNGITVVNKPDKL
jgi:hypothetical protein